MSGERDILERLKDVARMVGKMCSERRPPRMSIPTDKARDEDWQICRTAEAAGDTIKGLRAMVEAPCPPDFVRMKAPDGWTLDALALHGIPITIVDGRYFEVPATGVAFFDRAGFERLDDQASLLSDIEAVVAQFSTEEIAEIIAAGLRRRIEKNFARDAIGERADG
jgi:hypothetical protein